MLTVVGVRGADQADTVLLDGRCEVELLDRLNGNRAVDTELYNVVGMLYRRRGAGVSRDIGQDRRGGRVRPLLL